MGAPRSGWLVRTGIWVRRHPTWQGAVRSLRPVALLRGPAYHARNKQILNQRRLSKKVRAAVARAVVCSRLLYGAGTWYSLSATDINAMKDTYMAPFRTIANERWRRGRVSASSQELVRPLGILDFQEAVSMQRLRLAARLVNAAPSLYRYLRGERSCSSVWLKLPPRLASHPARETRRLPATCRTTPREIPRR